MSSAMLIMVVVFVIGYFFIAMEHSFKINKSASALLLAVAMWTLYVAIGGFHAGGEGHEVLIEHLGDTSEILFFLLGAMTIVETIDHHGGFSIITDRITTKSKKKLLWVIGFLTFFMSAVLDNLTTAIVMVALLRKLITDKHDRWFFGGVVILAANAGGAWSPIGDVTTIMLWIKGNITAGGVILQTLVPSLVCLIVPLIFISMMLKGEIEKPEDTNKKEVSAVSRRQSKIILFIGVGFLLFTPVFKTITHLPPYLGILLGLGVLWVVTDIMHKHHPDTYAKMNIGSIITRVDTPSVLFFLGILMAVACLQVAGHLTLLAETLDKMGSFYLTDIFIGAISSIVDNVPLVAAAMGMYEIAPSGPFMMDGPFWEFLAYCAGTGGSLLIIGSAAGVAVMGMEKIDFVWYLKHISLWALLGYLAGAGTYILMQTLLF